MRITTLLALLATLSAQAFTQTVGFDFNNLMPGSGLPVDVSSGGLTAHITGTAQSFSFQNAGVLGFTPFGFTGVCIYPNSVFAADLQIDFSKPIDSFSIMYSPEEYACDSSATMRVTAFWYGTQVGTSTATAPAGTWPTGTLKISLTRPFNSVIVHYDKPPVTGGDWGPVFMADNMNVTLDAIPQAVPDAYSVSLNKTLTVTAANGVLQNDLLAVGATAVLVGLPLHGKVTLATDGSFTYTPDLGYVGADKFSYEDSLGGHSSNHAAVNIKVQPVLKSLALSPNAILGSQNTLGTVTLATPAPVGGTTVALTDNSGSVLVPLGVAVPSGATSVTFVVKSSKVAVKTVAVVTASLNGVSKPTSLTLHPLSAISSISVNPTSVVGGTDVVGTVTLVGLVPVSGEVVLLTTSHKSVTMPASVTVAAGKTSATFTIHTNAVAANSNATLYATFAGVRKSVVLAIRSGP